MDNQNMNPMQQAPETQMPPKKGHGALVTVLVLIVLAIIALAVFGKKDDALAPADTVGTEQTNDSQDLSSIEADLEATTFEGVSDGL